MFRDVKVLESREGERGLDGDRLVRWSGILLYFPCFTGISTRGIATPIFPESPPFYEGLDSILEMDTIFDQVPMALVILEVFSSICFEFSRRGARTLDVAFLEICVCILRQNALAGSR